MKHRKVIITLARVYEDIDAQTYKFAQVSATPSPVASDEMQSDHTESLDGHLLARNVEYRDAQIRSKLGFCLEDYPSAYATDELKGSDKLVYHLSLDDSFKDVMLDVLATYIHRYLYIGALFDWYGTGMGNNIAGAYSRDLEKLENEITNCVRSKSVAKRPMQPFGPAQKLF